MAAVPHAHASSSPVQPTPQPLREQQLQERTTIVHGLSPYHFYFLDERDRLVDRLMVDKLIVEKQQQPQKNGPSIETTDREPPPQPQHLLYTPDHQNRLLHKHWYRDRTVKRRQRKLCHHADPSRLSQRISTQWKNLAPCERDFCKAVSAIDMHRYRCQVQEQKKKIKNDKRRCRRNGHHPRQQEQQKQLTAKTNGILKSTTTKATKWHETKARTLPHPCDPRVGFGAK
jgi:hypothetical protein